jgi:hypothetical protein
MTNMLRLVGVEDGDRVAVGNLDYSAFEDAGCGPSFGTALE